MTKKAYARAGVDVDLGNVVKERIHGRIRETHGPEVLGKIGGFGGLFAPNFSGMREPVLVASVDGVGTKLKIAFAMKRHDTVGADLVNHCVNDIAVLGARPLFFLDYIGAEKLEPRVVDELLRGFTRACRTAGCALIGGETAQMPDMYRKGEYDLAGCIVGVVDRAAIIDGRGIKPGDAILGLPSNGLHTNGYSLARKIFFEKMRLKPSARVAGLTNSIGDELMRSHKNYQPLLEKVAPGMIKGLAHITGGGLVDNIPRVLPEELRRRDRYAQLDRAVDFHNPPGQGENWPRGNVSGFQYGNRDGGDRLTCRCERSCSNPGSKADRSDRARQRQDNSLLGIPWPA